MPFNRTLAIKKLKTEKNEIIMTMKNIFKSILLLACGTFVMASCSDDNDSNPTVVKPDKIELFTPALANAEIDLANSTGIDLVCTYPDYGFPVLKTYAVEVSLNEDMSDSLEMSQTFSDSRFTIDAGELASTLTTMQVEQKGKLENDFPMNIKVYLRVRAALNGGGKTVAGSEVYSNVVSLNHVNLAFSLPPVTVPQNLYITGGFSGWSWDKDKCFEMVPIYDARDAKNQYDTQWRLVWIDDAGIKFNSARDWDGGEQGFDNITIDGDLASEIISGGGNIASSAPKWYLMIVKSEVKGRDIAYTVTFNKAEVWLIGTTSAGLWDELADGSMFSTPTTADGEFISPAFVQDAADDSGVRAYVKIPGFDWWKSEFIIFDGKIAYRGTGGDQERVGGSAGQKLYLNFADGTGEIK